MVNPNHLQLTYQPSTQKPIKIPASWLSFLTTCDSCQWYDYHIVSHPRGPFPGVFNTIDGLNKKHYHRRSTKNISPDLPEGTLNCGEMFVRSDLITLPGHGPFYLTGRLDAFATFDGDAGFGIVDFKTIDAKTQNLEHYGRQLGCYALALDNPERGKQKYTPVDHLGLLCLVPREMRESKTGRIGYLVESEWVPFERDDSALLTFIADRVLSVLELPHQPEPSPDCDWCEYRWAVERES